MSHPKCAKRVVIGDYNSICQMFLCIERLAKSEKSEKLKSTSLINFEALKDYNFKNTIRTKFV